MRSTVSRFLALAFASTALLAAACSSGPADDEAPVDDGSEQAVGTRNMAASAFGLQDKEIVLTLDDGPGARTVEVAEWLAKEKIPAVFFMVGKNAKASPAAVQRVVDLSNANNGLFIVANHSMNHQGTPLPRLGTDVTIREIMDADAILKNAIAASQSKLPNAVPFFRPPYGAFSALGEANIARINAAGAAKYTGPVFWDIGGELAHGFAADWACWGQKVSVETCTNGYIAEANARKKGVMLVHDVHSRTVDMLTGSGPANGRSLVKELQRQGYKFVSIRAHDSSVHGFGQSSEQLASNTEVVLDATVDTQTAGKVKVDARVDGGARVMIALDNATPTARAPGAIHFEADVSPGQHYVTITVLGANGGSIKQQRYPFLAPTTIDPESEEANGQNCIALGKLRAGQKMKLFHTKVACSTAGASHVEGTSDCYKYAGELTASRDPSLSGAREWNLEFDVSYAADPRDKSKLGLVMEAGDGSVDSGRRFWPGTTRPDVNVTVATAQCDKGLFAGQFVYANGTTEDLLIVAPKP